MVRSGENDGYGAQRHTGRPVRHREPWEKITVNMLDRHAAYLDLMSVLIRLRHHRAVSRADLIRALIDFMQRSRVDFTRFATAQEISEYLVARFRKNPHRGEIPRLLQSTLFNAEQTAEEAVALTNVNA